MTILIHPEDLAPVVSAAADLRHKLHRHPEIGLDLPNTEKLLLEGLRKIGVDEIVKNIGGKGVTGTIAVIRGRKPGRTIGLRADSDALPLDEHSGSPWSSELPKHMHACGHDGHTATLFAVASWLVKHRDFAGNLVCIFQPGEEGFAGGRHMIEDGLAERFGIDEFYALHSEPTLELGKIGFVPGYATGNADVFEITFEGKGGHGSRPHLAHDPIVAASEAVMAFQTISSRSVMPDKTAVVSVCSVQAGNPEGTSVIPRTAVLRGTTRSYEPDVQDTIERRMREIASGIAAAYEMKAEMKYTRLYPAMYNNPDRVRDARALVEQSLGKENVVDWHRNPGGEDFSFMLNARPGCLFRLGMKDEEAAHGAALHSQYFDFNDKAIAVGASALLTIALNRMSAA